jgi:phage protein D
VINEVVRVSVDGVPQDDLVDDLAEVDVEEAAGMAGVFGLQLALQPRRDGSWTYVDDSRFLPWRRLTVDAGYPGATETIIDGYVTHVEMTFPADGSPTLAVSGMDASALLDLEAKQRAWPDKADHEIAQAVFAAHGLSAVVQDTVARRPAAVATVLQTETDIRFLRRLAARNGFECYVQEATGYFRSPDFTEPPQKPLSFGFDAEANLVELTVRVDATAPTGLEVRRIDPLAKQEEARTVDDTPRRRLGRDTLAALRADLPPGRALVRDQVPASAIEMYARLRAGAEPASRFVTVSGEIDSRLYRAVLRARRLVTVRGAGARHSGLYYVSRVRHTFTPDGYAQRFDAYRNAVGLTGSERFSAAAAPTPLTVGGGTSRVPGNRVLPAEQTVSTVPRGSPT